LKDLLSLAVFFVMEAPVSFLGWRPLGAGPGQPW